MKDCRQNKPTIAWLVQGDESFGVRRAVLSLTGQLRRMGVCTPILCLESGGMVEAARANGLGCEVLGLGRAPDLSGNLVVKAGKFVKGLRFARHSGMRLRQALEDHGAEAVHFLWPNLLGVAGYAARTLEIPCFWEMPNTISDKVPFQINRRLYQRLCRRLGVVPIANSRYTGATLGDRPVRPRVVHLGVDPSIFDPAAVDALPRLEVGIPEASVVLGIIARLDPCKGQDRVLEAILALAEAGHDLHLLLLGGPIAGRYAQALQETAGRRDHGGRLHLVGNTDEPERYYGMIDIAVNCLVGAEAFGLSVIEAMMMATPVLAHRLGGPGETILDGRTGWLIDDPSVASIRAGIERALADRPRWPMIRAQARSHALACFTVGRQAQEYLKIVRETLNGDFKVDL